MKIIGANLLDKLEMEMLQDCYIVIQMRTRQEHVHQGKFKMAIRQSWLRW